MKCKSPFLQIETDLIIAVSQVGQVRSLRSISFQFNGTSVGCSEWRVLAENLQVWPYKVENWVNGDVLNASMSLLIVSWESCRLEWSGHAVPTLAFKVTALSPFQEWSSLQHVECIMFRVQKLSCRHHNPYQNWQF